MVTLKFPGARVAAPEALKQEIAAAQEQARAARAESERLATGAAAELDDARAEAMLTQSRAQERAARRAEARIPELREKLADALWAAREQAFQCYKKQLTAAAKKAITAFEAAAEANAALASLKQAASAELGNHVTQIPLLIYTGILLPDLVATWRRHTERSLQTMESAQLTRPTVPTPANDGRPMLTPRPGPVALVGGVVVSNTTQAASAAPAKPAEATPAPKPAPKREPRHDRPPAPGQRQIKFMRNGTFPLPDGRTAGFGDRVNLAEADAEKIVRTGSADFVDAPAPVVGDAKLTLPGLTVGASS